VFQAEQYFHGTPSGIDNTVIVYERPIYFVKNRPFEILHVPEPIELIIADTGIPASTKNTVEAVAKLRRSKNDTNGLIEEIGSLTQSAKLALSNANREELGYLMNQNHKMLQSLTVSSTELDHLVETAQQAGAYGAKLSGGGRGGNMIAIVDPDMAPEVKNALKAAGAANVFQTELR
jgi:mevalonate kinase